MSQARYLQLDCPVCFWGSVCDESEIRRWLATVGMLRRNEEPTFDEMRELLFSAAGKLTCAECQHTGLMADDAEDPDDWPEARRCEICQAVIPAERLEVFPGTRLCVACQKRDDRGDVQDEPSFCPRCGGLMVVRQTGGRGLTRYQLVCSESCRGRG